MPFSTECESCFSLSQRTFFPLPHNGSKPPGGGRDDAKPLVEGHNGYGSGAKFFRGHKGRDDSHGGRNRGHCGSGNNEGYIGDCTA